MYILESFLTNRQIYFSFGCAKVFCTILEKSLKIDNFKKSNWLDFKTKLVKHESHLCNEKHIVKLIECIDTNLDFG
jgi:hypothetical protein